MHNVDTMKPKVKSFSTNDVHVLTYLLTTELTQNDAKKEFPLLEIFTRLPELRPCKSIFITKCFCPMCLYEKNMMHMTKFCKYLGK